MSTGAKFAMSMRLTMIINCIIITMSYTNDLLIIFPNPDNITETISIKIANQVYDNVHILCLNEFHLFVCLFS